MERIKIRDDLEDKQRLPKAILLVKRTMRYRGKYDQAVKKAASKYNIKESDIIAAFPNPSGG